jgi:hypothetical protein
MPWKTHVAIGRLSAATKGADAARHGYQKAREVIALLGGDSQTFVASIVRAASPARRTEEGPPVRTSNQAWALHGDRAPRLFNGTGRG